MTGERWTEPEERTAIAEWIRDQQDRQAIRELAAAYQRGCDGGWDGPSHAHPEYLAALFAPDATYKIPQREQAATGHDEIQTVFAELQTSLPRVIHYLMNDTVTVHGDTALGEFKGIAAIWAGTRRQLVFGVYTGDFVRLAGRWHFQNWRFDLASPPRRVRNND